MKKHNYILFENSSFYKIFLLFSLGFLFSQCGEDTPIPMEEEVSDPLVLIDKVSTSQQYGSFTIDYTETYHYDDNNLLIMIDNDDPNRQDIEFYYNSGVLDSIAYVAPNYGFVSSTNIKYENGRPLSFRNTDENWEDLVTLIYEDDNVVERQASYTRLNGDVVTTKALHTWNNDQLMSEELYDEEEARVLLFDYKNDDKTNPFYEHPAYIGRIEYYSKNNITLSSATDYIGLYDPVCYICPYTYEYNEDGLPIKITTEWVITEISYK